MERFGIVKAVRDYLSTKPHAVPPDYQPYLRQRESSGLFDASAIGKCPRKDAYGRAEKLGLLAFKPAEPELKVIWAMLAGVWIEECVVIPALRASERYTVLAPHANGVRLSFQHETSQRKGIIDALLIDQQTGGNILLEIKTSHSQSWTYKHRDAEKNILPIYRHYLRQLAWYSAQMPALTPVLVEFARDHIGFGDEYIVDYAAQQVYTIVNDSDVRSYDLPENCDPQWVMAEGERRLKLWRAAELPPAEPYESWECGFCGYAEGCKANLYLTAGEKQQ